MPTRILPLRYTYALAIVRFRRFRRWCILTMRSGTGCAESLTTRRVWLAFADHGVLLGLMVLDGDWVEQLYIDPAWTGRGLGTRLLELGKQRRPDGLQLWTFVSNVRAQRFYERNGFAVEERTDGSGNEEQAPDLRYVWRPSA